MAGTIVQYGAYELVSRLSIVITTSSVVVLDSALFLDKGSALLQDDFTARRASRTWSECCSMTTVPLETQHDALPTCLLL